MPQAVITVAGILPPGEGKKQGKVQDNVGGSWNVWADKLHNYQIGMTYNIAYEENEFKGTKFYVIKTATPVHGVASVQQAEQQRQTSPLPGGVPLSNKDEHIFVCGALNNAMSNPNIQPFSLATTELTAFVNLLRQVWRLTLGKTQQNKEMDDEIPF